jgi:hypothetical protein
MRVNIKTKGKPIKDADIKALYLLDHALKISSDKMRQANLNFVLSKWNLKPNKP